MVGGGCSLREGGGDGRVTPENASTASFGGGGGGGPSSSHPFGTPPSSGSISISISGSTSAGATEGAGEGGAGGVAGGIAGLGGDGGGSGLTITRTPSMGRTLDFESSSVGGADDGMDAMDGMGGLQMFAGCLADVGYLVA